MVAVARRCALRLRVPASEIDDAVSAAVAHLLEREIVRRAPPEACQDCRPVIYTTALHRVTDHLRAYRRRSARESPWSSEAQPECGWAHGSDSDPGRGALVSETRAAIGRAAARLTDRQRHILRLHYVMGRTACDIATAEGTSTAAVEQALHRARLAMRRALVAEGWTATDGIEGP